MSWAKICSSVIPAASSPYKSKRKSFKSGTASLVGATSKVSYKNKDEHPTPKKCEFEPTLVSFSSGAARAVAAKSVNFISKMTYSVFRCKISNYSAYMGL